MKNAETILGRSPEQLTLGERFRLAGQYIALEIYSPKTIPLRRIEAIGASIDECVRVLKSRGLEPRIFEYQRLTPPY